MHVAIVSPHRDDAAFSCGLLMLGLLRSGCDVTVCNLFTRSDYAVTDIGVDLGANRVDAVSSARLREDECARAAVLKHVGSRAARGGQLALRDSGWLDAPLRLHVHSDRVVLSPLSPDQVLVQARHFADLLPGWKDYDAVFAPLALGDHIDHRIAREAARLAVPRERLAFYQDLPYAARLADEERTRQTASALVNSDSSPNSPTFLSHQGGATLKRELALCYPSQIEPAVADEIAAYGASLSGVTGSASEAWFAPAKLASRMRTVLSIV